MTLQEKLLHYSTPEPNCGCWLWTAMDRNATGYGGVRRGRKIIGAHRASWESFRGPIPKGMMVLHKCDVPCCINPDHLFLGTQADNMADRDAKGRHRNAAKTRCPRGHPYDGDNIYLTVDGHRQCRTCRKLYSKQQTKRGRRK